VVKLKPPNLCDLEAQFCSFIVSLYISVAKSFTLFTKITL